MVPHLMASIRELIDIFLHSEKEGGRERREREEGGRERKKGKRGRERGKRRKRKLDPSREKIQFPFKNISSQKYS